MGQEEVDQVDPHCPHHVWREQVSQGEHLAHLARRQPDQVGQVLPNRDLHWGVSSLAPFEEAQGALEDHLAMGDREQISSQRTPCAYHGGHSAETCGDTQQETTKHHIQYR